MGAAGVYVASWIYANIGEILFTAAMIVANKVLAPDVNVDLDSLTGDQSVKANTRGIEPYLRIVYGENEVGGNDVFIEAVGTNNKDLWIVQTLCEGPIEGLALDGGYNAVYCNDELYSNFSTVWLQYYEGTSVQTVDSNIHAAIPKWTDPMHYTAYIIYKIGYDTEVFTSVPTRTSVVQGLKLYDIRTSTTAYSANGVLALYNYMTNDRYGLGYDSTKFDTTSWQAAANYMDTKGWEFNIVFTENDTAIDIIETILAHIRCQLIEYDGKFYLKYMDLNDEVSVLTLTDDDIVNDAEGMSSLSITEPQVFDKPDGLKVQFTDADRGYVTDAVLIGDVNGQIQTLSLLGCNNRDQAMELGYYHLERAKLNRIVQGVFVDKCAKLEPHDIITVSCTWMGLSSQEMRVISVKHREDGFIELQMMYESLSLYNTSYDSNIESLYECIVPDYTEEAPQVSDVTVTWEGASGATYDYRNRLHITFTPPTSGLYKYTKIWLSLDGGSTWTYWGWDTTGDVYIDGLGTYWDYGDTIDVYLQNVTYMDIGETIGSSMGNATANTPISFASFFGADDALWGGSETRANATIILDADTPKIAMGVDADSITFSGTETGLYIDGAGQFRVGGSTYSMSYNPSDGVLQAHTIRVGIYSASYIDIDGDNTRIRSSNYVPGVMGAGFNLEPDLLEVGNIKARGAIQSSVIIKETVNVVGGALLAIAGDTLTATLTGGGSVDLETMEGVTLETMDGVTLETMGDPFSTITIEGRETLSVGDILHLKSDIDNEEWIGIISGSSTPPTYDVDRDLTGLLTPGEYPEFPKGTAFANYGQSGDGAILIDGENQVIDIFTHAGEPWNGIGGSNGIDVWVRIGDLNGYHGLGAVWGIASYIDANNYFYLDSTNGLELSGDITITGGSGISLLSDAGAFATVDNIGIKNEINNGDFEDWTNGTSSAPDSWTSGGSPIIAQEGTTVKIGSYSYKMTRNGTNCYIYQTFHAEKGIAYWQGRTVTLSVWVWASVASAVGIYLYDNASGQSTYHSGSSSWELLTVTHTFNGSATFAAVRLLGNTTDTSGYFDGVMCVEGEASLPFADRNIGNVAGYHSRLTSDGLDIFDGSNTKIASYGTSVYLGDQDNEHVKISSTGMEVKDGSTVMALFGSAVRVGQEAALQGNIYITSGAIQFRVNTTVNGQINTDGSAWFGTDQKMGWDSSGNPYFDINYLIGVVAGDTVVVESTGQSTTTSVTPVKKKSFQIGITGEYRVKWDHGAYDDTYDEVYDSYTRVYCNDVEVGSLHTFSAPYSGVGTYSWDSPSPYEDLDFEAGDIVDIYLWGETGTVHSAIKEASICADTVPLQSKVII